MVDFPDSPVDGQQHVENGQVWTFRDPPGAWAVGSSTGLVTEIVDADIGVGEGWQIIGGQLICWGTTGTSDASGESVVTFPKVFDSNPVVATSPTGGIDNTVSILAQTTTDLTLQTRAAGQITEGRNARYVAVGPCQPADAMPTHILGSGVQEFHDPTGAKSWRIIGTTLECWGNRSGAANPTITFPKTFALPPAVTAGANGGNSSTIVAHPTDVTTIDVDFKVRSVSASDWGNSTNGFWWHAIGQWDGVS